MEKHKILVVDDEPDVVMMISKALEAEDFEVSCAYDGIGAIDMAESEDIDLILLDIMMPLMSGYEVAEQLKSNPATAGIPIMTLSSAHSVAARERSREAGAVTLVMKPFTPAELVAQIRRHLPQPAGQE